MTKREKFEFWKKIVQKIMEVCEKQKIDIKFCFHGNGSSQFGKPSLAFREDYSEPTYCRFKLYPTELFKFSDKDEQDFVALASSMLGEQVHINIDTSWDWVSGEKINEKGEKVTAVSPNNTHVCYLRLISIMLTHSTQELSKLPELNLGFTKSRHWLANRNLHEIACLPLKNTTYGYKPYGFALHCHESLTYYKIMAAKLKKLFPDIVLYKFFKKNSQGVRTLFIVLPDVALLFDEETETTG